MPPNPNAEAGPNFATFGGAGAAGGIVGTNQLQPIIDKFSQAVDKLSSLQLGGAGTPLATGGPSSPFPRPSNPFNVTPLNWQQPQGPTAAFPRPFNPFAAQMPTAGAGGGGGGGSGSADWTSALSTLLALPAPAWITSLTTLLQQQGSGGAAAVATPVGTSTTALHTPTTTTPAVFTPTAGGSGGAGGGGGAMPGVAGVAGAIAGGIGATAGTLGGIGASTQNAQLALNTLQFGTALGGASYGTTAANALGTVGNAYGSPTMTNQWAFNAPDALQGYAQLQQASANANPYSTAGGQNVLGAMGATNIANPSMSETQNASMLANLYNPSTSMNMMMRGYPVTPTQMGTGKQQSIANILQPFISGQTNRGTQSLGQFNTDLMQGQKGNVELQSLFPGMSQTQIQQLSQTAQLEYSLGTGQKVGGAKGAAPKMSMSQINQLFGTQGLASQNAGQVKSAESTLGKYGFSQSDYQAIKAAAAPGEQATSTTSAGYTKGLQQNTQMLKTLNSTLQKLINSIPGAKGVVGYAEGFLGNIGLAKGGLISEPVTGIGAKSGKRYQLGEAGPEYVIPAPKTTIGGHASIAGTSPRTKSSVPDSLPGRGSAGSATTPATTTGNTATGAKMAAYAQTFATGLNHPYVWGGSSPTTGWDCSGFAGYVYKHFGYDIPRTTEAMWSDTSTLQRIKSPVPGALVLEAGSDGTVGNPGHVGIYLSAGKMVAAADVAEGTIDESPQGVSGYMVPKKGFSGSASTTSAAATTSTSATASAPMAGMPGPGTGDSSTEGSTSELSAFGGAVGGGLAGPGITTGGATTSSVAAAAAAAGGTGTSPGTSGGKVSAVTSGGSNEAVLKATAAKFGWTGQQWTDLYNVEMAEAGFNLTATNPSSGAYGMAQFINGPSEYAQYGGNSTTAAGQALAMANYIKGRYGTPAAAWAHEQADHWYAGGGPVPNNTLALVGEKGPELAHFAGGGTVYNAADSARLMSSAMAKPAGYNYSALHPAYSGSGTGYGNSSGSGTIQVNCTINMPGGSSNPGSPTAPQAGTTAAGMSVTGYQGTAMAQAFAKQLKIELGKINLQSGVGAGVSS